MIDDYLARLRRALKLPDDEREAVLDEVRTHLQDEAKDLETTGLSPDEAMAEAVRRFGEPEEIAAGYDADTGEVRRDGEVMLKVARVAGRGAKVAAAGVGKGIMGLGKLVAIVVTTALIVAGVIAVAAIVFADDWAPFIEDTIEKNVEHRLYYADLEGGADEPFYTPPEATVLTLKWHAWSGTGCTTITLTNPNDMVAYDRELCDETSGTTTLEPVSGTWQIETAGDWSGDGYVEVSYRKA